MYCVEVHRITTFALNDLFLSHDVLETYTYIYIYTFSDPTHPTKKSDNFRRFSGYKKCWRQKERGHKNGQKGAIQISAPEEWANKKMDFERYTPPLTYFYNDQSIKPLAGHVVFYKPYGPWGWGSF